jgi:hypothetical protein
MPRRQWVRNAMGGSPTRSVKRRASVAREKTPTEVVDLVTYLFTEVLDGRNASLTDGVQRALGRPPGDFRAYARRTAATGVWNGVSDM